jgi:hypothetical protein
VGTIGSLNDFKADEQTEGSTPELVAKYNGVAKVLRSTATFEVLPLGTVSEAPTYGAHARSWARIEGGELVLLAFRPPMPGEENPLTSQATDSRVKDVIQCTAPVIIASRNSKGITQSSKLAIVSYSGGQITLRRQEGKKAEMVSHYFGGAVTQGNAPIEGGWLKITVEDRNSAGKPLEWIEISIS